MNKKGINPIHTVSENEGNSSENVDYCFKSKEQGGLGFSDVMDYMGVNYK